MVGKTVNCNTKPPVRQPAGRTQPGDSPGQASGDLLLLLSLPGKGQVTLGRSLDLAGLSFFICAMKTTLRCERRNIGAGKNNLLY